MPHYAAMIRGIGPGNPNMRGAKLAWAFEEMGFTTVRPFLTSGNVLFDSDETNRAKLEAIAEEALPRLLGFEREVFIRSQADLQALVQADPFAGLTHQNSGQTYLTVTFFKKPPELAFTLPYQPAGKAYRFLTSVDGALCTVVDISGGGKTPDLMAYLDRQFTKTLTTRTYNTVTRLLTKLN